MLGALLGSVAFNVSALGLPQALTGPVRRGDADAVRGHLAVLGAQDPEIEALYRLLVAAQLPMARALAEAPVESFDAIAAMCRQGEELTRRA